MKIAQIRSRLLATIITAALTLCPPLFGQETTDLLSKALDLVHQVESPTGTPPTDAQRIDLLTQAIERAQEAPNHRLKGHRVLAIEAIRSAIAEIKSGDPDHKAGAYLHSAETELETSVSLARAVQSSDVPQTPTALPAPLPAPASAPQSADDYVRQGTAKANHGDWNGGMADYDQAIKLDPKNIRAYLSRGFAEQVKDPKGAMADFNQAIALDPKNVEAYEDLATVKWMHQDYNGTIAVYDQLIALDPKDWSHYGSRALAKEAKGDLDGAIADYDQDILREPADLNAFHNRGQLKEKKGDFTGALADTNQAIALGMHDGYVYRQRADLKKALGDLVGAVADYDQVIALDPKNDNAFVNLDEVYLGRADVKLARRDLDGAVADYNRAILLHAEDTQGAYFRIWVAQELHGKKADADSQLSSEMAPSAGFTWYWPAKVSAFLLGQTAESDFLNAAASTEAGKDALQHCQAWYYAGIKDLLAENKSTAAADFQKCVATNQKDESTSFLAQAELKALEKQSH
jgi:tetratricopeptide (TPR) repeat protein